MVYMGRKYSTSSYPPIVNSVEIKVLHGQHFKNVTLASVDLEFTGKSGSGIDYHKEIFF